MTFAFYELALNPDIQVKVQNEIDRVVAKHENKVTYEAVQEMEYLDWVVQGTIFLLVTNLSQFNFSFSFKQKL